jgi:hypothetical protein
VAVAFSSVALQNEMIISQWLGNAGTVYIRVSLQNEIIISHRLANAGTVYMRVSEHSNNLQVPGKLNNALT